MEVFNNSIIPKYFFNGPFRFVKAYEHCYQTHAKGRWIGNPILDVLEKEFRAFTRENNDSFDHYTLRVEPPIMNVLPKIIFEDNKFLVISKPPYISVHAAGGFHFNSLVGLLKFEMGYKSELYILHRIDKLTTGVLIMAKDRDLTKKFHESDEISKTYLARVHGNFPHENLEYEKPIYCISKKVNEYAALDSTNEEEIKAKGAKQSKTVFKKIWYDEKSDSSLLECKPITGRTHQIRVHLSSLGYPIINDVLYGGKFLGNGFIMVNFPHLFTNQLIDIAKNASQSPDKTQAIKATSPHKEEIQNKEEDSEIIQKKQKNNDGDATTTKEKVIPQEVNGSKKTESDEEQKVNREQEQKDLKEVGDQFKLSEEDGMYKLEGHNIGEYEWSYKTEPMEICLHSIKYVFDTYVFEDEKPYWADQNFQFKI